MRLYSVGIDVELQVKRSNNRKPQYTLTPVIYITVNKQGLTSEKAHLDFVVKRKMEAYDGRG